MVKSQRTKWKIAKTYSLSFYQIVMTTVIVKGMNNVHVYLCVYDVCVCVYMCVF